MFLGALTASRMQIEGDIAGFVALLAPFGLTYGWHFYFTKIRREPPGWRNRISTTSLALASLGVLLWPTTMLLAPKADWQSYVGIAQQIQFVESWEKVAVRTLFLAFVLCFFGRARLIVPIGVGCVGAGLFWLFSTIP